MPWTCIWEVVASYLLTEVSDGFPQYSQANDSIEH